MSLQHKAYAWIGRPIGVSLVDGTGVSGILCSIEGGFIYVIEYLYHTQFATKHYVSIKFEIFSRSRNALSLNRLCTNRNLYISLKKKISLKRFQMPIPVDRFFLFYCLG
jgi:hypothetical protein